MDRRAAKFVAAMARDAAMALDSAHLAMAWGANSVEESAEEQAARQALAEARALAGLAMVRASALVQAAKE